MHILKLIMGTNCEVYIYFIFTIYRFHIVHLIVPIVIDIYDNQPSAKKNSTVMPLLLLALATFFEKGHMG